MKGENWIITKLCKSVTNTGKEEYINTDKKKNTMIHDFRLFNEENVICAYGVSDNDRNLEPVAYYANTYGCVRIEYRKNSYWKI